MCANYTCLQVDVTNTTDALMVRMEAGNAHTALLSGDFNALNCDRHIAADWQACGSGLCSGTGCVRVAPPCPTGILSGAADDIACPDNIAAQLLGLPANVTLALSLEYDDGQTRPARYPPRNNATLSLAVVAGENSCEVVYDGTTAPVVRARSGTLCGAELCRIQAIYSDSCGTAALNTTVDLHVVVARCLQPGLACPDDPGFDFGQPSGTSCTPVAAAWRTLPELQCSPEGFAKRTVWVAALMSQRTGLPQGVHPFENTTYMFACRQKEGITVCLR